MSTFDAMMLIESRDEETTIDEVVEAFQTLIDDGIVWNLQCFYGRTAMRLIETGLCYRRGE